MKKLPQFNTCILTGEAHEKALLKIDITVKAWVESQVERDTNPKKLRVGDLVEVIELTSTTLDCIILAVPWQIKIP